MRAAPARRLPARAWLGLASIALAWPASWCLSGLRTHLLFFPLWLGYVLFLDGWTERRDGSSLWTRAPRGFALLFALSVPLWWAFEAANGVLGNWEYLGREHFGDVEYAFLCSLAFSTVVPAVLVSAEWARGLAWIRRLSPGPRVVPTRGLRVGLVAVGAVLLALTLSFPRACYPGIWIVGVLLLEPLVLARGRRGLTAELRRGDWRPWLALWTGGLLCGFFWELWNWRSYPKWTYHTPGVGGPRLFEMPLAGYLGYLPFALEVYLWKELWLVEPELLAGRTAAEDQRQAPGIQA
jgi:hypothetical protein